MAYYKQSTAEGCLIASLYGAAKLPLTNTLEHTLLCRGFLNSHRNFLLGMAESFAEETKYTVCIHVHYKRYAKYLTAIRTNPLVQIVHTPCVQRTLLAIAPPYCLYIDHYCLQYCTHTPHFITVLHVHKTIITVHDSWTNEISDYPVHKVFKWVTALKKHICFSPIILKPQIQL